MIDGSVDVLEPNRFRRFEALGDGISAGQSGRVGGPLKLSLGQGDLGRVDGDRRSAHDQGHGRRANDERIAFLVPDQAAQPSECTHRISPLCE